MNPSSLTIGGAQGTLIFQTGTMGNRHGLVAGATGTGKTVSLQTLTEGFSRMGTPVFAVDVKGDLSGIAASGAPHPKIDERLQKIPLAGYRQQPRRARLGRQDRLTAVLPVVLEPVVAAVRRDPRTQAGPVGQGQLAGLADRWRGWRSGGALRLVAAAANQRPDQQR